MKTLKSTLIIVLSLAVLPALLAALPALAGEPLPGNAPSVPAAPLGESGKLLVSPEPSGVFNRYIDINLAASWTDVTDVEVQAQDIGGLTDTDSFQATIADTINTAPTISGLPDQTVPMNGSADNAIDLWAYASDAEDADAGLTFTIINSPATSAGVSIDSNRYMDISPAAGWTGATNVDVQVQDTGGLTDTDSFQVTVTGSTIYLPLVMRRWPPVPDTPVLHAISNPYCGGNYTVSWDAADRAQTYTLEEDDNAAFSSPETRHAGSGTSWNASGKAAGTYYYRVKASNSWGDSDWSGAQSVSVRPPDTPVLNPISNPDGDGNYTVSWNAANCAETYALEEDDNAAFSSPETRYTGAGTSWNATGKAAGTYYYRVKTSNSVGDSGWSNVQSVSVQPPSGPEPGFWKSTTGDEFYVTADRAYVDDFAIYIYVSGCGNIKITRTSQVPISDNRFSFTGSFYANGTFGDNTHCSGQDGLDRFYIPGCGYVSGGPWSYSATWQHTSAARHFHVVERVSAETGGTPDPAYRVEEVDD